MNEATEHLFGPKHNRYVDEIYPVELRKEEEGPGDHVREVCLDFLSGVRDYSRNDKTDDVTSEAPETPGGYYR